MVWLGNRGLGSMGIVKVGLLVGVFMQEVYVGVFMWEVYVGGVSARKMLRLHFVPLSMTMWRLHSLAISFRD